MEEHDSMDALDAVGDSQLSYSADIESESNSSSTCCSSSSSTTAVNLHTLIVLASECFRKKNYKNNRGLFGELENRIMGGRAIEEPTLEN